MNNTRNIKCLVQASLFVLLLSVYARAFVTTEADKNFIRTHFTHDDDLHGNVVNHIAQTSDGFLWLIVNGIGLVRFDGKNFYKHDQTAGSLAVAPDGDIWIGTAKELIHIPASNFNQFTLSGLVSHHPGPGKASEITCLRFSKAGVLWVGTAAGLFRYEGNQFVPVGPRVSITQIVDAPDGHLLVINEAGFMEFADSEELPHPRLAAQLGAKEKEIFYVLRDHHGNTWYCTALGVAREKNGRIEKLGTYGQRGHGAFRAYEDPRGTIWIAKEEGLFRTTSDGLELVAARMQVRSFYNDRDGNLWVGTNGDGLYKYKERAIQVFTVADGLPNDLLMAVIERHDGSIWTGANCGGLTRFDGTRFQTYNEKDGLLNGCVWALAEDANRDLWIGTWGGGAFRYHNGTFTQYSKNQGVVDDRVTSIVAARDGSIWFGTRGGLTRLKDGQMRTFTTADGLSGDAIMKVYEDRTGVIWISTRQGLDRLVGDRFENFSSLPKAFVLPIGEDRSGGFYVNANIIGKSASTTTMRLNKDRIDDVKELPGTYAVVETEQGELWLGGNRIARILPGKFAQPLRHDEPLDHEDFSLSDGLTTTKVSGAGQPAMTLTRDGKLLAATPKGLAMFDLRRLPIANDKTSIYLTNVTIGRTTEPAPREIVLPAGTSHLRIDFAVVEISAPEKIYMQYRLDGVDSEWLDAGTDPHAIYTYIPVGTHQLHVRACNRHGIWDRQGVVFSITQKPYFYQTRWFIAAMVGLALLLMFLVYRLRVAQISRQMSARFDERLDERTRMARELHDTLLQTVQGSKMVADHALKNFGDDARTLRALEQLSTWLAQATEEGRAALHSLRASALEKNDLADALRRAIDECSIGSSVKVSLSVNGDFKEIHPVVRDEMYRIGYEAIRNSCAHSKAIRLDVTLDYAHDLTLRISDNGVGIAGEVIDKGKEGHYGLRGMRERAERIGGKFNLVSSPDSGTTITLVVPGRLAFRTARRSWFQQIKSLFTAGSSDREVSGSRSYRC